MSFGDHILLAGESTIRNVFVGLLYLFTFPIWFTLLPFLAGFFVWRNSNHWAEVLAPLPGINSTGGLLAGGFAFVYVFVLFGLLGAVLPSDTADTTGQSAPENEVGVSRYTNYVSSYRDSITSLDSADTDGIERS